MNIKNTSWNSYLETLRVEIDQAMSGCFALSTHHNKFHRLTVGLSHFSKKLIDFVDEKRTATKEELFNFQGLIKILLNLNHFIDDFSDFSIDKTIEVIGIDFFNLPLNVILEFITNFNRYVIQLELPQISIDEVLLKGEDNIIDIAQLLNFIQSRSLFLKVENKDTASLYENLTNKVFAAIESDDPNNHIIREICVRRKEFLARKGKSNSKATNSTYYGSTELYKAFKSSLNVKIINHSDIDVDRSHCVHHGKYSNFFSGVLKSSKRIVSFEIYQSIILSQDEYNAFVQKVKIMSEANYFTTIPLIGVVLDEPFVIISEFMPQRSLFDWFHGQRSKEFANESDSHATGLESGQQRKFKMQFDQGESLSNDIKSRPSILTLNSSSSFGSYQQIRKESRPPKKELRQTIIALGVAYALRYLHSKGIVHMSLKTSEIFIDANGRPKIKCSKKARKVNTKIDKISSKDVKAWTAPELIESSRFLNENNENENEMNDDETFDEDSVGSNSGKDRSGISHCSSVTIIDAHPSSHNHPHPHINKKEQRKLISIKKYQSANINFDMIASPAPIPPMPNSNDIISESSNDLLNQTIVLSNKVDVYAYGIMLWELLTKEMAFAGLSSSLIAEEVLCNDQRPLIPQNCPAKLVKLIQDCWAKDPKLRPDFDEICCMFESGNYNFPGTDTEELNSYKAYCSQLIERLKKKKDKSSSSSEFVEFAEFDKFQLTQPDSFYDDPKLNVEMMINKLMKEGSCEDIKFIKKLSELVKSSCIPKIDINSFQLRQPIKAESNEKEEEKEDSVYIFNESSLSLLSSFFLSSNLDIRLIAVDLVTYIYNNHLFNDERSIAGILPKIVRNISQISSLSTQFVNFRVTEAQEILLTSMKLLTLFSSKYVTSGFINNKISNASINSIINTAFSDCSSLREVSFDFYISFLSKFQAPNKLLIRFITKMAHFDVRKAMCIECIKIIKVLQLISRNDRLFTLISLDEKTLETVSNFLIYDELGDHQQEEEKSDDEIIHDQKSDKEEANSIENSTTEKSEDASNFQFVLKMMKSKENKSDGILLKKLTHKENAEDVVIASLRLLFTLVSGSQYLHYYTKMVDKLSTKLLSNNKIISSLACSVIARLIPTISENKEPFMIPADVTEIDLPDFNCDEFAFLKDDILLKISEDLNEYSIRLFGAISSTYVSAVINTRNDEIILQRILKKMRESLKPISKKSEKEENNNVDSKSGNDIESSSSSNSTENVSLDSKDKDENDIGLLFNKISLNMRSNLRSNNMRPTMKPNLKVNSSVDAFPLLFQKKNGHHAEEEKKKEEEGRLAALVLESQSSQTPSSRVLLEAIDTFFDYYFFFNENDYIQLKNGESKKSVKNEILSFDEEDKFRECLIFLSNMSLDPNAALSIFKRIDKILHITSLKNSPAASTFFHVLLTYEVQERIRRICKKYLQNDNDTSDENEETDDDDSEYENDEEIELLNGRDFNNLIEDIINKCVCFWNTIYFEDALKLLEFFSTIRVARKILIKFKIDSKIREFIKVFSAEEKRHSLKLEIQEEKNFLEKLRQQQINQQKLTESLLMPQKSDQDSDFDDDIDEIDKAQKQLIENQQKNQILSRQVRQQEEKVEHLLKKDMKVKIRDTKLRGICNRILSRFV